MRDLRTLPKAHLHLHVDGAMRANTLAELAGRYGIDAPVPAGFDSFDAFFATLAAAANCLRTEADVRRLIREIVEDAAEQGVRWIEPSMWPGLLGGRLGPDAAGLDLVLDAGLAAGTATGVGFGLVVAANRGLGAAAAEEVARLAVSRADRGVVGFGLDGDEAAAGVEMFTEAAAIARAGGLPVVPHAGELGGADEVARAVDLLGARRIMHGTRCVEDPDLVARLATEGIALAMCPTSNALLSAVPSLPEHPLPKLLAAGVRCSVNADDPMAFGSDLVAEYEVCRDVLGLDDVALADVARTSFLSSAAPAGLVERALADIDAWLR